MGGHVRRHEARRGRQGHGRGAVRVLRATERPARPDRRLAPFGWRRALRRARRFSRDAGARDGGVQGPGDSRPARVVHSKVPRGAIGGAAPAAEGGVRPDGQVRFPPPRERPGGGAHASRTRRVARRLNPPGLRWSFSNIRQLVPTRAVPRGDGAASALPRADRSSEIDAVRFQPLGRTDTLTWAESLDVNHTDGIVVVHQGRLVYERYFGVSTPETPHITFSVTKSIVGTLAAMLIAEGTLDPDAVDDRHAAELVGRGLAEAAAGT